MIHRLETLFLHELAAAVVVHFPPFFTRKKKSLIKSGACDDDLGLELEEERERTAFVTRT